MTSNRFTGFVKQLGLVVCLLSLGLWGVSEIWNFALVRSWIGIGTGPGFVAAGVAWGANYSFPKQASLKRVIRKEVYPHKWWPEIEAGGGNMVLQLPFWVIAGMGGLVYLIARVTGRRHLPGHCQHCGYDLTGNVSGTCPECGKVMKENSNSPEGVTTSSDKFTP